MELQIYNIQDRNNAIEILNRMKFPIKMLLDGIYPDRSTSQNRYLHYLINTYAEHIGESPKRLKEDLQKEYVLIEEEVVDGKVHCIVESTAKMKTGRLEWFAECIRRDAMLKYSFYLPMPNEIINDKDDLQLKLL